MHSKMRSALVLFAVTSVSLVRGTRDWRIAGARARKTESLSATGAHTFARIAQLLLRLVRGEESNNYVFETIHGARNLLGTGAGNVEMTELLCVARMLYALGYISPQALTAVLFTHAHYSHEDLLFVEKERMNMLSSVNVAIAESQL